MHITLLIKRLVTLIMTNILGFRIVLFLADQSKTKELMMMKISYKIVEVPNRK